MRAPVVKIFRDIDDFCKEFYRRQPLKLLPNPGRKRARRLGVSEIITILVLLQLSHYRGL